MKLKVLSITVVGLLLTFFSFAQNGAGSLKASIPNGRPSSYITPSKTDKSLFYIQRNHNQNTIVYDAVLLPNGQFASSPVDEYWLRYGSTGERKELTWVQKTFAYGYSSKKDKNGAGCFITLSAYNDRDIYLTKNSKGKPVALLTINGKRCQLEYIWVFADNSGSWPKVIHVDLHGRDLASGYATFERIKN